MTALWDVQKLCLTWRSYNIIDITKKTPHTHILYTLTQKETKKHPVDTSYHTQKKIPVDTSYHYLKDLLCHDL